MNHLRDQFPILKNYTYLNTARFCAQPDLVNKRQTQFLSHLQHHGSWEFSKWNESFEATREASAALMGARPDQIVFLSNVSTGFNIAASYLPKLPVLCIKNDFPTVNIAWEPHGYSVEMLDHTDDHFEEILSNRLNDVPHILSLSWIQAIDGYELDLELIYQKCKEHGHILVLDATQGVGAIPFKVNPEVASMVLVSGFKWTLAGYGIAIGYVSDQLVEKFSAMRGWNSLDAHGGIKKGALSLEVGNATFINTFGLSAGLEIILTQGIEEIMQYNLDLKNYLKKQLDGLGRAYMNNGSRSSILRISANEDDFNRLEKAKVQVTKQSGTIRVSPNFYNTKEDLDKFLNIFLEN